MIRQVAAAQWNDDQRVEFGQVDVDRERFPIRLDLSDYALWLAGSDVWDHSGDRKVTQGKHPRRGAQATIKCFHADLLTHENGGIPATVTTVHDVFERVPGIVVLDDSTTSAAPASAAAWSARFTHSPVAGRSTPNRSKSSSSRAPVRGACGTVPGHVRYHHAGTIDG